MLDGVPPLNTTLSVRLSFPIIVSVPHPLISLFSKLVYDDVTSIIIIRLCNSFLLNLGHIPLYLSYVSVRKTDVWEQNFMSCWTSPATQNVFMFISSDNVLQYLKFNNTMTILYSILHCTIDQVITAEGNVSFINILMFLRVFR